MAPRTAAWRFASSAKIGLSRDIPLAAALITGLGLAVCSTTSDMKCAVVVREAGDGAKPIAGVVRMAAVRRVVVGFIVVDLLPVL